MAKYRNKPIVVEAIQWTGKNNTEVEDFLGDALVGYGDNLVAYYPKSEQYKSQILYVRTSNGTMNVYVSDYIIKNKKGSFYRLEHDIFEKDFMLGEE